MAALTSSARSGLENINPQVYGRAVSRPQGPWDWDDDVDDPIDAREVFDLIRHIRDPEHPLTLEELNVVEESGCEVLEEGEGVTGRCRGRVKVVFTPTIPHCSMASLIGLTIKLKLLHTLPPRLKVEVEVREGSHTSEAAINKQLGDKERVAAALENPHLLEVINKCLAPLS